MRRSTYVGPKLQVQPDALDQLEATGLYVAEEKFDGYWVEVTTDAQGNISKLVGRSGKTFSGDNVRGLLNSWLGVPNSIFVGELEAGTEAANKTAPKFGSRRIHIFDVVQLLGTSTVDHVYEKRRELLELMFNHPKIQALQTIVLVKQAKHSFRQFFNSVVSNGGEGLVIKRLGKQYKSHSTSGKTDHWLRCKKFRYVDYVVVDVGHSEGGSLNLEVGLFVNGSCKRVATIKNLPRSLDPYRLIGTVIECKGAEVHSSGALRHGHFERIRDDKLPEECTLESALTG
jgi:ATP-dependent DNA ligase